ncbi:MAG: pyridoxal-dependent decarboxylase [Planctomycetota bacterium]
MPNLDPSEFREAARAVLERLAAHLQTSADGVEAVVATPPVSECAGALNLEHWLRDGGMSADELADFVGEYLRRSTHLHSPGFMAHQVAVPHFASALADLVCGMTNNGMAVYEMGPPAVAVERAVLAWMRRHAGFVSGSGVLVHGGSLANLTALLAARAAAAPSAWQRGVGRELVVLAPASSHYSVGRAVAIAGLGERAVWPLPTDDLGVLRPEAFAPTLAAVRAAGKVPIALVANACATATGLYDPVAAAADFCDEHGLWLHVDGCHGASALLSPAHRHLLAGVERASSLVWDAHKMLRTSVLCAGVLFRDAGAAGKTFQQDAKYFRADVDAERPNLFPLAVECTKTALGLKLLLTLAFVGEAGMAAHVASAYDRTRRFHDLIADASGFTCAYSPQANILCFRYGDDDQEGIRRRLLGQGRFHLSATVLGERRWLRMVVMNDDTDEHTVEAMLDAIRGL